MSAPGMGKALREMLVHFLLDLVHFEEGDDCDRTTSAMVDYILYLLMEDSHRRCE